MPWMKGKGVRIQQDGATPHTGNNTVAELELAGKDEEWQMKIVTQSSQSPDLNVLDLGFFHSLKTKVSQIKAWCTDREEFMETVQQAFDDYPMETLDGIWACLYNNYRSIMACDGDNQYKQAHNHSQRGVKITGSRVDLKVNLDDYNRLKNKFR
jgi:hypothetical protein